MLFPQRVNCLFKISAVGCVNPFWPIYSVWEAQFQYTTNNTQKSSWQLLFLQEGMTIRAFYNLMEHVLTTRVSCCKHSQTLFSCWMFKTAKCSTDQNNLYISTDQKCPVFTRFTTLHRDDRFYCFTTLDQSRFVLAKLSWVGLWENIFWLFSDILKTKRFIC